MKNQKYKTQVRLLIDVLPDIAKENNFALHGGTAINLFVRNMPRISVDIDLTYLLIEDRTRTLSHINEALEQIKRRIEKTIKGSHIAHNTTGKLLISLNRIKVKVEVNLIGRGTLSAPIKMSLCDRAQSDFDSFVSMPIVPIGQLYGGKICVALDRQHPRDLFDVKYLLENEGFSDEIRKGFLLYLLCSNRPIHEMISPNLQNQRQTIESHFRGMSEEKFSYDDFEQTREKLIKEINRKLTKQDKTFLLSIKSITPDWSIYNFEHFPAVQWKLKNLKKLKTTNPQKHERQYQNLKKKLYYIE